MFHDTLSDGLSLNVDSITVLVDVKDYIIELLHNVHYSVRTTGSDDGCGFEVEIPDLRALVLEDSDDGARMVASTDKIIVQYTAKLTDAAKTGTAGNNNKAVLEFSNDPYDTM